VVAKFAQRLSSSDGGGILRQAAKRRLGLISALAAGLITAKRHADRPDSCSNFLAKTFRVLLTAAAYVPMQEMRLHLSPTRHARAQVSTLREHFQKLGAQVIARCVASCCTCLKRIRTAIAFIVLPCLGQPQT
jgi:hypothetical protein